ncbi:4Fe-4S dicluster domain-containing protein [Dehalobacterium formicoaceticum]|uniref:4Fe-4S binding protein n=1 Tax=Dehalobacterium formicoaceticum TaxID=51515 RepID=A0ABT1Y0L0_9FIRM|nr:4Fe-4S dicluster domain-containing protein [Dehalobacterium formicoaceticum]MCR6544398.1 4Fe-4S binding protein [Dehalobacterium formicoaceticum]
MKNIIVVDAQKCVSCHSCEISCCIAHSQSKNIYQAIFEKPLAKKRVVVEKYGAFSVPLQCRHCEDAPCVQICPTKAMHREAGADAVLINEELCIGCKWCLQACPFGAITLGDGEKAILKCDLCIIRTEQGLQPACVDACPTNALKYLSVDQFTKEKRRGFLVDFFG